MIAEDLRKKKEELGLTTIALSKLSGVPVGTINKILNGETKSPRMDTLEALEKVLFSGKSVWSMVMHEEGTEYGSKDKKKYTIEDYRALGEDRNTELIDGELVHKETPDAFHQLWRTQLGTLINQFISNRNIEAIVITAPLDVQLDCDDYTVIQPDIMVLCDMDKLNSWGVYGAPDMVIEITSPGTRRLDYIDKMVKCMDAGVREFWVVDPCAEKVFTYIFDDINEIGPEPHTIWEKIPVHIFDNELVIDFAEIDNRTNLLHNKNRM